MRLDCITGNVSPEKARKLIAESIIYDKAIRAPTWLLLGPPGVGKSVSAGEGIALAASALVAAFYELFGDECEAAVKCLTTGRPDSSSCRRLAEAGAPGHAVKAEASRNARFKDFMESSGIRPDDVCAEIAAVAQLCSMDGPCTEIKESIIKAFEGGGALGEAVTGLLTGVPKAVAKAMAGRSRGLKTLGPSPVIVYDSGMPEAEHYEDAFVFVNMNVTMTDTSELGGLPFPSSRLGNVSLAVPPAWARALRVSRMGS
jgi:hypothetical protein